jgi:hypothetical protein
MGDYQAKYLKYKQKYLTLKKELEGGTKTETFVKSFVKIFFDLLDCRYFNNKEYKNYLGQFKTSILGKFKKFYDENKKDIAFKKNLGLLIDTEYREQKGIYQTGKNCQDVDDILFITILNDFYATYSELKKYKREGEIIYKQHNLSSNLDIKV